MEENDQEVYDSFARLLHNTSHTPLFLEIFEDFTRALLLKNPERQENVIKSSSIPWSDILQPLGFYKARVLLPKLSEDWVLAMNRKLNREEPISDIPVEYERTDIRKSLERLSPETELNDEIVNAYLTLIRNRLVGGDCLIATTRLLSGGILGQIDRMIGVNTFTTQKIIVPIHEDYHWTFVIMQREGEKIQIFYYNSSSRHASPLPTKFRYWFRDMFPGIRMRISNIRGPQQHGTYDCGVLMLIGIRLAAVNRPPLSQEEADQLIPSCRGRILAELLVSHLDPEPNEYENLIVPDRMSVVEECVAQPFSETFHGVGNRDEPINIDDSPIRDETIPESALLENQPSDLSCDIPQISGSLPFFSEAPNKLSTFDSGYTKSVDETFSNSFYAGVFAAHATGFNNIVSSEFDIENQRGEIANQELGENVPSGSINQSNTSSPINLRSNSRRTKLPTTKNIAEEAEELEENDMSKPAKRKQIQAFALNFATEEALFSTLSHAVQMQRIARPLNPKPQPTELASLWCSLEADDIKPRSLQVRQNRQKFSEQFISQKKLLRKSKSSKQVDQLLKDIIGIRGFGIDQRKRFKAAVSQAQRSSIWTELSDLFKDTLGDNRFVALAAISEATTTIEALTMTERVIFLEIIQSRVSEPDMQMLKRLRAASNLYSALVSGELPYTTLQIERCRWPLHGSESFGDIMSLKVPPQRRALPKR